jgi:hypothetical protein
MKKEAVAAIAILLFMALETSVLSARATQATVLALYVPFSVYVGSQINMSITLTDAAGNNISGAWVNWYLNGHPTGGAYANAGEDFGNISCSFSGILCNPPSGYSGQSSEIGTYTVEVTFNGTSDYAPAQAQALFTVLAASATTTQTSQTTTSSPSPQTVSLGNQTRTLGTIPTQRQSELVTGLSNDALALSVAIVIAGIFISLGIFFGGRARK